MRAKLKGEAISSESLQFFRSQFRRLGFPYDSSGQIREVGTVGHNGRDHRAAEARSPLANRAIGGTVYTALLSDS
jgi:hypothetical protein